MELTTFIEPIIGGVLIGLGSLLVMAASGKIPGVSGIIAKIIRPKSGDTGWRITFLLGLVLGAGLVFFLNRESGQGFSIPGGRGILAMACCRPPCRIRDPNGRRLHLGARCLRNWGRSKRCRDLYHCLYGCRGGNRVYLECSD